MFSVFVLFVQVDKMYLPNKDSSMVRWKVMLLIFILALLRSGACQKVCTEQFCQLNDTSLRFFLIGDWGGLPVWPYYTSAQKAVAKAMELVGDAQESHFQMALGDNFYIIGVKDVDDPRFKKTFEDIYSNGQSNRKPWYVLAGNHDHYGNASAQIAYSKNSNRWIFPDYYYSVKYRLRNGVKISIFVIDTVQLCGNTVEGRYKSTMSYLLFGAPQRPPQGPDDPSKADQQWRWLEQNLQKSEADYIFVAGHYPVWSIAEHGPTKCLVQRLRPLLQKYRVNAYLSGHDHNLQHLQEAGTDGWRVDYVISGAAAYEDNSNTHKTKVPPGSSKFFYPKSSWDDFVGQIGLGNGGFVFVEVTPEAAWFRYALADLKELHSFKSAPRTKVHPQVPHA